MSKRGTGHIGQKVRNKAGGSNSFRTGGASVSWSNWGVDKPSPDKMRKLLHFFTYFTLTMSAILALLIIYYSIFPLRVTEVSNAPYQILNENKTVKAGGLLQHKVDYCKYVNISSETIRQFVNGLIFTMPSITTNNPVGCHEIVATTLVPKELPVGEYYMKITKIYRLNAIRTFTETYTTEKFKVTE